MDNAGIKNRVRHIKSTLIDYGISKSDLESIMDDIDDIVHYSVIVGMKKAIEEKKEKS